MKAETSNEFWHTLKGEKIHFSEVTHQHWSNIYWYHRYLLENSFGRKHIIGWELIGWEQDDETPIYEDLNKRYTKFKNLAEEQIKLRFKGEKLDWIPIYDTEKMWFKEQNTRKILTEKFKRV